MPDVKANDHNGTKIKVSLQNEERNRAKTTKISVVPKVQVDRTWNL